MWHKSYTSDCERDNAQSDRELWSLILNWCRLRYTWDLFPEHGRCQALKEINGFHSTFCFTLYVKVCFMPCMLCSLVL